MSGASGQRGLAWLRWSRWMWRGWPGWLAVIGAALLSYANLSPWAELETALARSAPGTSTLRWGPATWSPVDARQGLYAVLIPLLEVAHQYVGYLGFSWRVAAPIGAALALTMLIWRGSRLAAWVYVVWLALVTVTAAFMLYRIFGQPPQYLCQKDCDFIAMFKIRPAVGVWLALVALALLWAAAIARMAARGATLGARPFTLSGALRGLRRPARMAALIYALGAAVWFFGIIFAPYATRGCAGFPLDWAHFVHGSCARLGASDALGAAWLGGLVSSQLVIFLGALTGLMMLVSLIAVWQPGWLPPLVCVIWAVLASWLVLLALGGLAPLLTFSPPASISKAPWVVGAGPAVTIMGAALVWVGVAALTWTYPDQLRGRLGAAPLESAATNSTLTQAR